MIREKHINTWFCKNYIWKKKPHSNRNYFISSSDTAFCFLVWIKIKSNWKDILISELLLRLFFFFFLGWKKDMWQFMLCVRDQNLALSLHDWWVFIWTGINVNSNCNNAYQRVDATSTSFPVYLQHSTVCTIAKCFWKPHIKSYSLLKCNTK